MARLQNGGAMKLKIGQNEIVGTSKEIREFVKELVPAIIQELLKKSK
jgi:hypothetical protein